MRIEEFIGAEKTEVTNGMLCTVHYYSDSEPFKVVRVSASGKTCWIRKLKVESPKNAEIGHQDWIITDEFERPNVDDPPVVVVFGASVIPLIVVSRISTSEKA